MASDETGWGKPTTDGVYWWRLNADDTPDPVTVRGDFAYDTGYPEPTSTSLGEYLGPISPSDAEQLMELRKAAEEARAWIKRNRYKMGVEDPDSVLDHLYAALHLQKETQ